MDTNLDYDFDERVGLEFADGFNAARGGADVFCNGDFDRLIRAGAGAEDSTEKEDARRLVESVTREVFAKFPSDLEDDVREEILEILDASLQWSLDYEALAEDRYPTRADG